jgi:hypothetical protein
MLLLERYLDQNKNIIQFKIKGLSMFGFGKKKAPLYTLLQPLEESYTFINEKLSKHMEMSGLSLANLSDGNILKFYIEPQVFSYVILIWGVNASRLDKSEKQFLCSSITKVIGQKISSFSEDDGANYLRDSLLAYGRESQNGHSDQLTRRITFKFMAEMCIFWLNLNTPSDPI